MPGIFGILGSVFFIILTIDDVISISEDKNIAKGRIKAFDDVLRMYGEQINSGKGLKYAVEEIKRLALNPEYNKEYTDYYTEMLELIESTGSSKIIQQETDRLNVIITSASNQRGAEGEIEYAVIRRNILGGFVDAAAEFVMHGMFQSPDGAFQEL